MTTKISSFAKRNPQFTSSSKTANLFQDETTCIVFSGRDSLVQKETDPVSEQYGHRKDQKYIMLIFNLLPFWHFLSSKRPIDQPDNLYDEKLF